MISLRAEISIDIEADDFVGAADHQRKLDSLLELIRKHYKEAELEFRERKPRGPRGLPPSLPIRHMTGRLSDYED
jgi:hypothetical protein